MHITSEAVPTLTPAILRGGAPFSCGDRGASHSWGAPFSYSDKGTLLFGDDKGVPSFGRDACIPPVGISMEH